MKLSCCTAFPNVGSFVTIDAVFSAPSYDVRIDSSGMSLRDIGGIA